MVRFCVGRFDDRRAPGPTSPPSRYSHLNGRTPRYYHVRGLYREALIAAAPTYRTPVTVRRPRRTVGNYVSPRKTFGFHRNAKIISNTPKCVDDRCSTATVHNLPRVKRASYVEEMLLVAVWPRVWHVRTSRVRSSMLSASRFPQGLQDLSHLAYI